MMNFIRFIFIGCFILMAAASCDEKRDATPAVAGKNENILRFDVAAPFKSLNPAETEPSGSMVIFPLLYSYLCVPDADGNLAPDLAETWIYDPETFSWVIRLRSDALFHNGQPVTANDVRYSLQTILKKFQPALIDSIRKIVVKSDFIVRLELKKDDPNFIRKIWDMEILPRTDHQVTDYYNNPVGSGPFQFSHRNKEEEVVLKANNTYYGGRPALDGVTFFYEPDKEKSWTRLLAGATDIAQEISPKNYEIMKQYENRFYFDHYTLRFYSLILYNCADPLFSNPLARQAMTYAIDREYIVKNMLNGYGKVAAGPMGIDSPFHNPNVNPLSYDPSKSMDLLDKAGWKPDKEGYLNKDGKYFEFTLLVMDESQVEKKIAQYIKLCFNDIGVKMHIQLMAYDELIHKYLRNNEFQAVFTELSGIYSKPERLEAIWINQNDEKSGAGGFESTEVSQLIKKAINEKNAAKQKKFLYEVDRLIASLQPGTFLFQKTAIDVMSRRFNLQSSFALSYPGIFHLKDASLIQN